MKRPTLVTGFLHPLFVALFVGAFSIFGLPETGECARRGKKPSLEGVVININTASVRELMKLPRIGRGRAKKIIALRRKLGRFSSVEQLRKVRGIGKRTLEKLRPYIKAGPGGSSQASKDADDDDGDVPTKRKRRKRRRKSKRRRKKRKRRKRSRRRRRKRKRRSWRRRSRSSWRGGWRRRKRSRKRGRKRARKKRRRRKNRKGRRGRRGRKGSKKVEKGGDPDISHLALGPARTAPPARREPAPQQDTTQAPTQTPGGDTISIGGDDPPATKEPQARRRSRRRRRRRRKTRRGRRGKRRNCYERWRDKTGGQAPPINVNVATAQELRSLPCIGKKRAIAIIALRKANGPFHTKRALKQVSGIGKKIYGWLSPHVSVKLDLNSASLAQLERLKPLSGGLGAAIYRYRRRRGPFRNLRQLMRVRGIGRGAYESIKSYFTIGNAPQRTKRRRLRRRRRSKARRRRRKRRRTKARPVTRKRPEPRPQVIKIP